MIKLLLTIILILLPWVSSAADWGWSKTDYAREAAGLVVTAVDWGQTRYIANHPDRYLELNPILGAHPSLDSVDAYFASVLVLHSLISALLPAKAEVVGFELSPRTAWQYFYIGVESTATLSNWRGGLKIDF